MIQIGVDQNFKYGFNDRVSGTGTVTVNNNILKCTGASGDPAVKEFYFPFRDGMLVEVEVTVRALQGEVRLGIDTTADGGTTFTNLDSTRTTSKEWTRMKLSVLIPYGSGVNSGTVVLGKWGSQNQTVDIEYRNLKISVSEMYGSPVTLAQGLVRLSNGTVDLSPNFKSFGISSLTLSGTDVKVSLDSNILPKVGANPIIQVTGTPDFLSIPLAGSFNTGDDSFTIKWTNGTAYQNMSSAIAYVFVSVSI
ncbi:hypothetical protein SB773_26110 [Bacillus sp. SIMBA_074]|uniref:hypothetical protein n=1 Tax=Bacillus sp. SIMBA_074 TaxID=3085812 RepID=UPI00397AFAC3